MAKYRLRREETLEVGLRRIVAGLADEVLSYLRGSDADVVESVHQARKLCKKARGLARLVRPVMGDDFAVVNGLFRDAGRALAPTRGAHAHLEAFESLERLPLLGGFGLPTIRDALTSRATEATGRITGGESHSVTGAIDLIEAGRTIASRVTVPHEFDSVGRGLHRTYKRGVKGYRRAAENRDVGSFHEWRKRVKYLWYETRLLRDSAPSALKPMTHRLHDLSDALGDAHDLHMLVGKIQALDADPAEKESLLIVANGVRVDLESRSLRLGRRLYAEAPETFVARMTAYWDAWADGEELPVGEIARIYRRDAGDDHIDTVTALFAVRSRS